MGYLEKLCSRRNADLKIEKVEKLFRAQRDQLAKEFWERCVKHVIKIEDDHLMSDSTIVDIQVDKMIFEVDPDDTSGSDASDSESEKSCCGSSIAVSSDVDSDTLDL